MRIRPGDLAISIHTELPQNNGLIVQVVRPYENSPDIPMTQTCWWCTCAHLMTWKVGERTVQAYTGPVPEACLFPIRGVGLDRLDVRAKRPSRNTRSTRRTTVYMHTTPVSVTENAPVTALVHEKEMADGVPA